MVDNVVRLNNLEGLIIKKEFNAQQLRSELPGDEKKRKKDLLRTIFWTGITAGLTFIGRTIINNHIDIPPLVNVVNLVSCVAPLVPAAFGLMRWEWDRESAEIKAYYANKFDGQATTAKHYTGTYLG